MVSRKKKKKKKKTLLNLAILAWIYCFSEIPAIYHFENKHMMAKMVLNHSPEFHFCFEFWIVSNKILKFSIETLMEN